MAFKRTIQAAAATVAVFGGVISVAVALDWDMPPFPTKAEFRQLDSSVASLDSKLAVLEERIVRNRRRELQSDLWNIEDRCRSLDRGGRSVSEHLIHRERVLRERIHEMDRQLDEGLTPFGERVCR